MPNKILVQEFDATPPQITFADFAGDFGPAAANDLRHASVVDTEVQMSLTGIVDGAARQSAKVDLSENRATAYKCRMVVEMATGPTPGNTLDLYWAPSQHATAGTGNAGGVSGADSAYSGLVSNLTQCLPQLDFIGSFVLNDVAAASGIQVAEIGILVPFDRYGTLVVYNNSGVSINSDDVETHVVLDPLVPEIQ